MRATKCCMFISHEKVILALKISVDSYFEIDLFSQQDKLLFSVCFYKQVYGKRCRFKQSDPQAIFFKRMFWMYVFRKGLGKFAKI